MFCDAWVVHTDHLRYVVYLNSEILKHNKPIARNIPHQVFFL